VLLTHANGGEVGDRGVGAVRSPAVSIVVRPITTSARRPGSCDACRGVLENNTCRRLLPRRLAPSLVAIGGRLPCATFFAGYDDVGIGSPTAVRRRSARGRPQTSRRPAGLGRAARSVLEPGTAVRPAIRQAPRRQSTRFAVRRRGEGQRPLLCRGSGGRAQFAGPCRIETVALGHSRPHAAPRPRGESTSTPSRSTETPNIELHTP